MQVREKVTKPLRGLHARLAIIEELPELEFLPLSFRIYSFMQDYEIE